MKKWASIIIPTALVGVIAASVAIPSFASATTNPNLFVLYAGSMTKVMEQKVTPSLRQEYGLVFQGEGEGSDALAQMIRAGISTPDIFISASPSVNQKLLMGAKNHNLVKWYFPLAADQLVIAFSKTSKFYPQLMAAEKGHEPWYKVLESPGFRFGRTDPLLDPKGLSTIFMMELAQKYYHQPTLFKKILVTTENAKQVFPEQSLLAQLTTGQVDAIVAYKHEAVEWHVPYITLPKAINLSDVKDAASYAKVSVKGKGGKVEKGAPILFTITIPSTVKNEQGAEKFVRFMVEGKGHQILMKDGFTPVTMKLFGQASAVPKSLQSLIPGKK